jgi:cyclase
MLAHTAKPGGDWVSGRGVKRGVIVARIKPGSEDQVAGIFAESDESELPALAGVTHRSLFVLDDIYVHYVEMDEDFEQSVDAVRGHPLFQEISRKLDEHITPYDPETWRSPKDATAREFYSWDADSSR